MRATQSEETFKILKLVEVGSSNQNQSTLNFRCYQFSTVGDLIQHLKQKVGVNFDYFLINKYGQSQSFNGRENMKLIELLEDEQIGIQYYKRSINNNDDYQNIQQDIQTQKLNSQQRKQYVRHPILEKLPQNQNNNLNNAQQFEINPYQISSQNLSRSISLKDKRNLSSSNSNKSQNDDDNLLNQSQTKLQDKSQQGYYVKEKLVKKIDPDQNLLLQLISRIQQLENQVGQITQKINSDQLIIEQFKQDSYKIQQQQQQDLQYLKIEIKQDIQQQLNFLHQQITNQNEKFITLKEQIEAKLSSSQNFIKMDNLNVSQTDSSPKKLMKSSNKKLEYDPSKISSSVLNTEQLFETQIFITLSCQHQIEKSKLEFNIRNSLQQGNIAKCQVCQTVISSSICRQFLGILGDQYLTIQNTKNLYKLYQYIKDNYRYKKILKCQNNICDFFCIFDQKYRTNLNTYYCTNCQRCSVME